MMASNSATLADNDGDYPDWLELYNNSEHPISLDGYGLSDRPEQPFRWRLPAISIQPHDYLLIFASGKDQRSAVAAWETIIDHGDVWKYAPGSAEIPADWNALAFEDSAWARGPSGLGYGDGDDATEIATTISVFARRTFYLDSLDNITAALLHIDYDDGFVAYLNGVEIARANLGSGLQRPAWDLAASTGREAKLYSGGEPERYIVEDPLQLLREGQNLLAIEVHNVSPTSSDLSLIPFFTLGFSSPSPNSTGSPEILSLQPQHLHCNFKIKSGGEGLLLTKPNGIRCDELTATQMPTDISWGRCPDGGSARGYFDNPTPGKPNNGRCYTRIATAVRFSIPGGIYNGEQHIELSADSSATIFYSLDGSIPDSSAIEYTDPISISQTTVLRARAFTSGQLPGQTVTQTFLIDEGIALPIVSLVTDPENLWDPEIGIYVEGSNGIPGYCSSNPKNWNQDWERPASLEFFEPDGERGFAIDCGIKIGGGCTRKYAQKSIAVYTRSEYGDTEINYRLFPDKPLLQYNNLMLRNGGQDWYRASIRDGMMQNLVKDRMDIDWQAYRAAILFLNGEYWGIHNLREKHNEHYLARNHGLDPDAIDILYANARIKQGSATNYQNLIIYLKSHDISRPEHYQYIKTQMDIDEYINYQIAEIYFANIDWPGGNIKYWRPRTADGKWRWILFDLDLGFGAHSRGQYNSNTLANVTSSSQTYYANPSWSTYLFRRLLQNESFRNEFIQRYCGHISTTFDPDRALHIIDSLKTLIEPQIPRHLAKWPDSFSLGADWNEHIQILQDFASARPRSARMHLKTKFDIPDFPDIHFSSEPSHMGEIRMNEVAIPDSGATICLANGIPFRCQAIARPGFHFTGWRGLATAHSAELTLTVTGSGSLIAEFASGESSALQPHDARAHFRLLANYPNPFNPITTIRYEIQRPGPISLIVYDLGGHPVETLVDEPKAPGRYVVQWDAQQFPSGVYLYKITAHGYSKIQKCVLLK